VKKKIKLISNLFKNMEESKDNKIVVVTGATGYVMITIKNSIFLGNLLIKNN
jgi:hypothetical protein